MLRILGRILSGMAIQTKILIFIAPISLFVIAIAVVSLLSGKMIGQQLDEAGQNIGTLSGFKQVYSEMHEFLAETTEERRDLVAQNLGERSAEMSEAIARNTDPAGRQVLTETRDILDSLQPRIADLWALHEKEVSIETKMEADLVNLTAARDALQTLSENVQLKLSEVDEEAKGSIRKADFLSNSADSVTQIVDAVYDNTDPQAAYDAITPLKPMMMDLMVNIEDALPMDQKVIGDTIASNIRDIIDIVENQPANDVSLQKMGRFAGGLRPLAIKLRGLGATVARESTKKFAELEGPKANAAEVEGYVTASRLLVNSALLETTALLGSLEESQLEDVRTSIASLTSTLPYVPEVPEADQIKEQADRAMEAANALLASGELLVATEAERSASFAAAAEDINKAWISIVSFANGQRTVAQEATTKAMTVSLSAAAIAVVFSIIATLALVGALKGPIRRLTETMKEVASGKLDAEVAGTERADEIGDMARALGIFKTNAEDKLRFEAEAEENRKRAEEQRDAADREKEKTALELNNAINALGGALRSLAKGDLTCTINTTFDGALDELRVNFNESVEHMREALGRIRDNAVSIQEKSGVLNDAANDLARRTEQQAASLEETAAAADEMTNTVKMSSQRAAETDRVSTEILNDVRKSGTVVSDAVGAMGRIEEASGQISQIIGVIDDIAFQTNLLALNAGVEAARAGEAGKGFAVVAQEVRELAQRSAGAAKEIKALIEKSSTEVQGGVRLVGETGEVISRINERIEEISRNITDMARAGQEQATGLQEVSSAVGQMDQMTQQNAAMVEETNAASQALALEAIQLSELVSQFRISNDGQRSQRHANAA